MRGAACRYSGGASGCGLKREGALRAAMGLRMVPMPPFTGGGAYAGRGSCVSPPKSQGKNDG